MNSMYCKAAFLCFLAFLFGIWQHNVGAICGWFMATLMALKLWAYEHKSQFTNTTPNLDA
jgi:hypothetical protein